MQPLRPRIYLNKTELALIRAGLDLIVSRLAGAAAGSLAHKHPWDRINFQASDIYKSRKYDEGMESRLLSLRTKLATSSSSKFRLDAIEFAAAALSLRLTRKKRLFQKVCKLLGTSLGAGETRDFAGAIALLENKLERYRRRAKRVAITRFGAPAYKERADTWRAFVQCLRYYFLYDRDEQQRLLRRPKGRVSVSRRLAHERLEALLNIASSVISERTTAQIPEPELQRLVRLLRDSLQHGRQSLTLREAAENPEKAKETVFQFIRKRFDLEEHIKFEFASLDVQQSMRGEKFRAYLSGAGNVETTATKKVGTEVRAGLAVAGDTPTLLRSEHEVNLVPSSVTVPESPPADPVGHSPNAVISGRKNKFPDHEVIGAIATWITTLDHSLWFEVIREAQRRVRRLAVLDPLPTYAASSDGLTLQQLVAECRPEELSKDDRDHTNYYVTWLMNAMRLLYGAPNEILAVLREALAEADRRRIAQYVGRA